MVMRLIKSVLASTYTHIEVIVIDDASSDGTAKAVAQLFSNKSVHTLITNRHQKHAAESRNIGMDTARGKYLFFIDDDNVLDKRAIENLVTVFESDETVGEMGLVNYRYSDRKEILWLCTVRDMNTSRTYQPKNLSDFARQGLWESDDVPNAFMIRARVLKKNAIRFSSYFEIMYEESDVAYRIRMAGYRIVVARDATIYHDVDDYLHHFMNNPRRWRVFARNRIIFHSVYSGTLQNAYILTIWIWIFVAYYAYIILTHSGSKSISPIRKILMVLEYIGGTFDGLWFIIRGDTLQYT
jgi:hypothetical protein